MKGSEDFLFLDRLRVRFGDRATEFSEDLIEMLHGIWRDGNLHGSGGMCDHCGSTEKVEVIGAMTAYTPTETDPHPNHPAPYCPGLATVASKPE